MQTELHLTGTIMQILVALGEGPLHGYAIMLKIKADTRGRIRINPSTLYRNLRNMKEHGLVEEVNGNPFADERVCFYYQLTGPGIEAGQTQLEYILELARIAQDRLADVQVSHTAPPGLAVSVL